METKTIHYRGGLVSFRIPVSWREEYEKDGGGTFYEDAPDSGILRLNVMTFKTRRNAGAASAKDFFTGRQGDLQIAQLPNGNAVARYVRSATEHGEHLYLHFWELASVLPPRHLRVAFFSYTMLRRKASGPVVAAILQELHKCITEAEFAPILGGLKQNWWWTLVSRFKRWR